MPRISELPPTVYPLLSHLVATSSAEGETVKLTLQQVREILALQANMIAFRGNTVEDALAGIIDAPVDDTIPDITAADAGKTLVVNANGTAFETKSFTTPLFKPITMTTPAVNATGLGANGAYTFLVEAFVGDTVGFYPDYPVPLASRFIDVFEPGGNAAVKRFVVTGTGTAFPVDFTGSGLLVSHAYEFQAGYIDAQGNSVLSQRVRATTAAQFKPSSGQAYSGGFLAFEKFGDGGLFDLVTGAKSTEASRQWTASSTSTLIGALSRLNGPNNTDVGVTTGGSAAQGSMVYARSISIGGVAGYLAAIDEARAISFKLRPSNAPAGSPFVSGGSEELSATGNWTSTELTGSQAASINMPSGNEGVQSKTSSFLVRPIKRIAVTPPIPIGTYVAAQGGWLWFYFTDLSSGSPLTYAMFKADKAVEVTRAWDTASSGAFGYNSRTNGLDLTNFSAGRTYLAAANYCYSLVHNGKDDWYLGAIDEMLTGYRMNSQLPSAQQFGASGGLWSSTETDASSARALNLTSNGAELTGVPKTNVYAVAPIRRVLLTAL